VNGLLLVNLGTPDAPTPAAVRRYLAEFLWDERVIDLHPVARAALLYGVVLPFRPARSARAYTKVWDPVRGSPLLFHGLDLRDAVAQRLGQGWKVELGMRYGSPALAGALDALIAAGCEDILVLPLYPQYASSSTGSTRAALMAHAATLPRVPPLRFLGDFYTHPGFIEVQAALLEEALAAGALGGEPPDHVLFSFHGLPERQVRATDLSPQRDHCLQASSCCERITEANRGCYRAQSYATARALADRLCLADGTWSVSFQSRLGRTPWIKPYTDEVLPELAAQGHRRIAVLCPSFTADCLETLEEIGMGAKDMFHAACGGALLQVPCVNADPRWAEVVAGMARSAAGA